jgi:hypothetical protein
MANPDVLRSIQYAAAMGGMLFDYSNTLNRENHQLRGQIRKMEESMETEQGRRRDLERTVDRLSSRVTTMESTLNAVGPLVRSYLSRTNLGSCRCWSPFMGVGLRKIRQPWQMMRVGRQWVLHIQDSVLVAGRISMGLTAVRTDWGRGGSCQLSLRQAGLVGHPTSQSRGLTVLCRLLLRLLLYHLQRSTGLPWILG